MRMLVFGKLKLQRRFGIKDIFIGKFNNNKILFISTIYYNKSDDDSYNKTLNWGFKLAILISFPTMLGLILLSDPILITLLNYKEF